MMMRHTKHHHHHHHRPCQASGGAPKAGTLLRAAIPVAFPREYLPADHPRAIENNFCMCPTALPVDAATPRARLARVRATFGTLKASLAPWMLLKLTALMADKAGLAIAANSSKVGR